MMGDLEVYIDVQKCIEVARVVKSLNINVDSFTNTEYYPPATDDPIRVASYFFFMVAIDHRTSRPSRRFEGIVCGKYYKGSDLLYRLGMIRYQEDPNFFSADRMEKVTTDEIRRWLSVKKPYYTCIWDPETRALLLRDAARKLNMKYSGNPLKIFEREDVKCWLSRLSEFLAYSDPVAKKSFLLIKFLERRGLIGEVESSQLEVPVDNHLTRIALRVGIVVPNEELMNLIRAGVEVSDKVDILVRLAVRKAFSIVCEHARIRPTHLDDLLWSLGRTCCTKERPVCIYGCNIVGECPTKYIISKCDNTCVFIEVCNAAKYGKSEKIYEHTKINTWYY